jgi:hypothetical protein
MSFIALTPDLEQFLLDSERQFRRITAALAIPTLIFMLSVPFIKLTADLVEAGRNPEGERIARLLQEIEKPAQLADKVEEPKPAEKDSAKPPEKAGPAPKKSPVKQPPSPKNQNVIQAPAPSAEQQVASARQAASRSGVMAFADQLADLRSSVPSSLDSGQPLQSGVISSTVGGSGPSDGGGAIAAAAGRGSGGIGDGTGAVTSTQSGTGLGTRRTTTVAQPQGFGGRGRAPGQGGSAVAGRTIEEIQLTFDRNKGSFYIIFNRALRDDASLGAGKIVVNLTIAPDGSVTSCALASSSFNNPELERKVIQRVMLMNFGAKNVPTISFPGYPINFLPS